ncbi:hypothetical protein [Nocardioides alcanivorans]|uniref:hypothetical protein n=1 Tax=Nocardioides alcanivorans TaxID=2897352 RepID=UPI001F3E2D7A|nr:hypothetical protein [Nocardioides alcanivorans]
MISRLTTADARLRAAPDEVGRVVEVEEPRPVPSRLAINAASGGALGMLAGLGLSAARRRLPEDKHRHRRAPAGGTRRSSR